MAFIFRGYSPTLVLTKFKVDPGAVNEPLIEICGRPSGIIGFVLTTIGLTAITSFKVTARAIIRTRSSLSGESHDMIPLAHVSSTNCGYVKPIGLLIGGVAAFIWLGITGLAARENGAVAFVIGTIILAICLVFYFLTKKLAIGVVADSGVGFPIQFKPSVIEGIGVDIVRVSEVIELINGLVESAV